MIKNSPEPLANKDLTSPAIIKKICDSFGFKFSKSLGQNYLADRNIVDKIMQAAEKEADPNTLAIEIGPGFGVLTKELVNSFTQVAAIEKDRSLPEILKRTVPASNLKLEIGDALKTDIDGIIKSSRKTSAVVVANLPYNITTPIIMRIIETLPAVRSMIVMVQEEVAERIIEKHGSRKYGALSVGVQYYMDAGIVTRVGRKSFVPIPNVDSAVIKLTRKETALHGDQQELLFKIVRAVFNKRRKTAVNAISSAGLIPKETVLKAMQHLGMPEKIRGEAISVDQFADLARYIYEQ